MESTTRKTKRVSQVPEGFDVTCVIGRVTFDETGVESAHVIAFKMIAEHEAAGHYTFPAPNGGTTHVTVEYENPADPTADESWR